MFVPNFVPIRLRRRWSTGRATRARPGRHRRPAPVAVVDAMARRLATTGSSPRRLRREAGQATAEYALVLLGAAAVALMLTAWAARSGAIGDLFDAIVDQLIAKAA
jgi:hypothetical protein